MATEAQANRRKERILRGQAQLKGNGASPVTEDNYRVSLMAALNYYNQTLENKERVKVVLNYLKKENKAYYEVISEAADYELTQLGSLITILNRGEYLSPEHKEQIQTRLDGLYKKYSAPKPKVVEVDDKPKVEAVSVEQRIIESAGKVSDEIDYAIDDFVKTKSTTFSTKNYLLKNGISGAVAKKIGEQYKRLQAELDEAVLGKDEQLKEGYGNFSKVELKKFAALVKSIVDDCSQHAVITKKPRVIKPKSPAILAKRVKYLPKFDELNLKSVSPSDMVGADEVWLYNTKNRKLIVYTCIDSQGLSIKGTTITNYSVQGSKSVTLRKPEEFFKGLALAKRAMNNALKTIKTKPAQPNGRINAEMIILGEFK